nr:helix-turn-helix domain-containing protein [uncultured Carboxylicivirga sp.]
MLHEEAKEELKTIIREVMQEELQKIDLKHANKHSDQQLLSRQEASEFLRCSLTTLYHHQRNGVIPFYQVGRKILFSKDDLLMHLKTKP